MASSSRIAIKVARPGVRAVCSIESLVRDVCGLWAHRLPRSDGRRLHSSLRATPRSPDRARSRSCAPKRGRHPTAESSLRCVLEPTIPLIMTKTPTASAFSRSVVSASSQVRSRWRMWGVHGRWFVEEEEPDRRVGLASELLPAQTQYRPSASVDRAISNAGVVVRLAPSASREPRAASKMLVSTISTKFPGPADAVHLSLAQVHGCDRFSAYERMTARAQRNEFIERLSESVSARTDGQRGAGHGASVLSRRGHSTTRSAGVGGPHRLAERPPVDVCCQIAGLWWSLVSPLLRVAVRLSDGKQLRLLKAMVEGD